MFENEGGVHAFYGLANMGVLKVDLALNWWAFLGNE